MTKGKEIGSIADLIAKTSKRLSDVEEDSEARIAESLLDEPLETPAEIAELEAITDEEEPVAESPKTDFIITDGPMKDLHMGRIEADEKN